MCITISAAPSDPAAPPARLPLSPAQPVCTPRPYALSRPRRPSSKSAICTLMYSAPPTTLVPPATHDTALHELSSRDDDDGTPEECPNSPDVRLCSTVARVPAWVLDPLRKNPWFSLYMHPRPSMTAVFSLLRV